VWKWGWLTGRSNPHPGPPYRGAGVGVVRMGLGDASVGMKVGENEASVTGQVEAVGVPWPSYEPDASHPSLAISPWQGLERSSTSAMKRTHSTGPTPVLRLRAPSYRCRGAFT